MNKTGTTTLVLVGLAAIGLFSWLGWIGGWSVGLGIVGVIAAIWILQQVPKVSPNQLTKFFLGWLTVWVLLPGVYGTFTSRAPMTSDAMEMRAHYEDMRGSEAVRPAGLQALTGYKRMADRVDDEVGLQISRRCDEIEARNRTGQLQGRALGAEIEKVGNDIKEHIEMRRRAGKLIADSYPSEKTWGERLQDVSNTPGKTVLWGSWIILVVAFIAAAATGKAVIKTTAISVVVSIILVFLANELMYGGLYQRAVQQITPLTNTAPATPAPAQQKTTTSTTRIEINDAEWSEEFVGPPYASIHIESPGYLYYKFPDGTIIKTDGKTKMGQLPSRRFRLKGKPGTVEITIH